MFFQPQRVSTWLVFGILRIFLFIWRQIDAIYLTAVNQEVLDFKLSFFLNYLFFVLHKTWLGKKCFCPLPLPCSDVCLFIRGPHNVSHSPGRFSPCVCICLCVCVLWGSSGIGGKMRDVCEGAGAFNFFALALQVL